MRLATKNKVSFVYGATGYGYTKTNPHAGTDYSWWPNPLIYAPENGRITYRGNMGACGNAINMTGQKGRTYRFCHLLAYRGNAGPVKEGQVIGVMGMSGLGFGRHLHFVMWINGRRVDGDAYIKKLLKAPARPLYYRVRPGDTLSKIAGKYKTTWQRLAKLNKLKNPNFLRIGQRLRIK